jgi:hypothetical protein
MPNLPYQGLFALKSLLKNLVHSEACRIRRELIPEWAGRGGSLWMSQTEEIRYHSSQDKSWADAGVICPSSQESFLRGAANPTLALRREQIS